MVMNDDISYQGQGNGTGNEATPKWHQEDEDDYDILGMLRCWVDPLMSFGLVLDEKYVYYVLFYSISYLPLCLHTDSTPYCVLHPPNHALAESNTQ